MAYINQEMKKEIMANVKKVLPQGWKATAKIYNNMKIVLKVKLDEATAQTYNNEQEIIRNAVTRLQINDIKENSVVRKNLDALKTALNCLNYDNSEAYIDYVDVGYYTDLEVIA